MILMVAASYLTQEEAAGALNVTAVSLGRMLARPEMREAWAAYVEHRASCVMRLAQVSGPRAMQVAVEIVDDPSRSASDRLAAAKMVLDVIFRLDDRRFINERLAALRTLIEEGARAIGSGHSADPIELREVDDRWARDLEEKHAGEFGQVPEGTSGTVAAPDGDLPPGSERASDPASGDS